MKGRQNNGIGRASGGRIEPVFNKNPKRKPPATRTRAKTGTAGGRGGKSRARPPGGFARLRLATYWSAVAGLWGLIAFAAMLAYVALDLPDPDRLQIPKRPPNITLLSANGAVLAQRGVSHGRHVRLEHMPRHLPQAVLAIEDARFYRHLGIDPLALVRATIANIRARRVVQGGSTITQQLAKNLFLKPDRTFKRKLQEVMLAVWLETRFSKDEILEMYLNRVYLGAGAYGVDAAAQRYFGKSARNVTLAEAALIAGLLKAPSRYAPTRNPRLAKDRAAVVVRRMVAKEFVSPEAGELALFRPAAARSEKGRGNTGLYAVDWAGEILSGFVGEPQTDLVVETSIDLSIQKAAELAVRDVLENEGKSRRAGQAAVVVMDGQGAVKALVGGRSHAASQFNRAVKARRQPGSAFKPFVFLTAIEQGYRPDSIVSDEPISIKGWKPRNYKGKYRGAVTLRESLAQSINTVAVRLARDVGVRKVIATARRLGVTSPLYNRPSLALGTAEVTLMEITGAYVPFANGGFGVIPHIIKRVRTGDGDIVFERSGSGPGRVIAPAHIAAMNAMMRATIRSGTGRRAALGDRPAGGKTGTTQGSRDAWFVGYTADLTAGVWVGNDSGKPMRKVTGGTLPAEIWRRTMAAPHQRLAVRRLPGLGAPAGAPALAQSQPKPAPQGLGRFLPVDGNFLKRLFGAKG